MTITRSLPLFVLAAIAEIGGAWLVWRGVRGHRGLLFVAAGIVALGGYGFFAAFQPDPWFSDTEVSGRGTRGSVSTRGGAVSLGSR